jgi:hypothetical protein
MSAPLRLRLRLLVLSTKVMVKAVLVVWTVADEIRLHLKYPRGY